MNICESGISLACKNQRTYKGYLWKYYEDIIEGEEWRKLTIDGFNIEVSSEGRIRTPTGKITRGTNNNKSYMRVHLGELHYLVHRLVCMTFHPISNPEEYSVDHIDENHYNNSLSNLRWLTIGENIAEAKRKPVYQIGPNGEILAMYVSISEASRNTGINLSGICACCIGRRLTAGGYKWKYAEKK